MIARKENGRFDRIEDSNAIMANINTQDLEYAAAISRDELEICFTRVAVPTGPDSSPSLYLASRKGIDQPFGHAQKIANIEGFVEGATYLHDRGIYFHKRTERGYRLFYSPKIE